MQHYKSEKTTVNAPVNEVYTFLSDFNNFKNLMPEQVTNWQSTEDSCSFMVQGLGELALVMVEKIPDTKIVIVPDKVKSLPVKFSLICELNPIDAGQAETVIRIEADLPPMIAMMAGKPLQNLVNILAQRLKDYFDNK